MNLILNILGFGFKISTIKEYFFPSSTFFYFICIFHIRLLKNVSKRSWASIILPPPLYTTPPPPPSALSLRYWCPSLRPTFYNDAIHFPDNHRRHGENGLYLQAYRVPVCRLTGGHNGCSTIYPFLQTPAEKETRIITRKGIKWWNNEMVMVKHNVYCS